MAYTSKSSAASSKKQPKTELEKQDTKTLPLGRKNFIIMIVAAAMIVVGFLLMLGGSSTTEEFNPDIFSARRVVVGPTIAFIGFVVMAVAILFKPRKAKETESQADEASDTEVEPGAFASKD